MEKLNSIKMKKISILVIVLVIVLPYIIIACITRLDGQLFRDEALYVREAGVFASNLPAVHFVRNICGAGTLLWGLLWKIFLK